MRNTYKYTKMYSGGEPQFVEGDVFRITIPLTEVQQLPLDLKFPVPLIKREMEL